MKKLFLLLLVIMAHLTMIAGEVTEQQALLKAQQFMQGKQFKQRNMHRAPSSAIDDTYYVFNVENNGGFVIVSADDRTEAILGYADSGNLDMSDLPANLKTWLGGYDLAIKSMDGSQAYRVSRRAIAHEAIAPLLSSQWGQFAPYNAQCPAINEANCPTGCVATAMAQLMYYHKWPERVDAIPSYYNYMQGMSINGLPATTFDWNKMKKAYTENDQANEVAKLMRYCGQATETYYGPEESAVDAQIDLAKILTDIFGYDKSLSTEGRGSFSAQAWEELIYSELALSRPVLYGAFTPTQKGHSFICDGYENGYFHINWGWKGDCNGFFLLSILDPNNTTDADNAYSLGQSATIGIKKNVNSGAGEEFTDGCFVFKILDEDRVWFYRTTDFYDNCPHWDERLYDRKAPLVVPAYVTHNNHQYRVTDLGGNEFNIYWEESGYWNEPPVTPPTLVMPETLERIRGGLIIQGYEDIVLTIPKNVKYIETGALFSGTNSFRRFIVDEDNPFYKAVDGVVYSKDGETLVQYPNGRRDTEYIMPEGVKTIMGNTFFSNQWIESIHLPESVEGEIGNYAFCDCYGLTSINLPDGITKLGALSLARTWKLKNITLPANLKVIDQNAFWDCPSIEEITIPGSCEYIGCQAFALDFDIEPHVQTIFNLKNKSALKKITVKSFQPITLQSDNAFNDETYEEATLYVPTGAKSLYMAAYGWKKFKHIVEVEMNDANMADGSRFLLYSPIDDNTVTVTGAKQQIFGHLTVPSSVQLNGKEYHVTAVKKEAFVNQTFSWLTLSEGVVSIGMNAIGQNWNLERIDLSSTFRSYDDGFVYDNPALAEITLAENNPNFILKDGVLYKKDMKTLVAHPAALANTELVIPKGVEKLERFSLADCRFLESVIIPNTVKYMDYAFYGLKNDVSIKSITIQNMTPPVCSTPFADGNSVYKNATLYVPAGSKAAYQADPVWGLFQHIEEENALLGDVTSSGSVDVQDATIVVNYILGDTSENYNYSVADMNNDGEIDVFDVQAIVNVILNNSQTVSSRNRSNMVDNANECICLTSDGSDLYFGVENAERFTSFQFNIDVPHGVKLIDVEWYGNVNDHLLHFAKTGEDRYTIVALSMSSTPLSALNEALLKLHLSASDDGEVKFNDILFVTPQGEATHLNGSSLNMTTGIQSVTFKKGERAYDMTGRQLNLKREQLRKGVYIINNKKVVIK